MSDLNKSLRILSESLRKLFRSEELSSEEFMASYNAASELCYGKWNRATDIIGILFDVCFEYIRESKTQYEILLKTYAFMGTHPIVELSRDVNSYILKLLKSDAERYLKGRRALYIKYISSSTRIVSFLNRFHMPNGAKGKQEYFYNGKYYEYRDSTYSMMEDIWDSIFF